MKLLKKLKSKIIYSLRYIRYGSGLFFHDCKKHKVYYKQPAPFDWYCNKCGEPW